jgi:hypothetical protein
LPSFEKYHVRSLREVFLTALNRRSCIPSRYHPLTSPVRELGVLTVVGHAPGAVVRVGKNWSSEQHLIIAKKCLARIRTLHSIIMQQTELASMRTPLANTKVIRWSRQSLGSGKLPGLSKCWGRVRTLCIIGQQSHLSAAISESSGARYTNLPLQHH